MFLVTDALILCNKVITLNVFLKIIFSQDKK